MAKLIVDKNVLAYVLENFENTIFHLIEEKNAHCHFSYSEDELFNLNEVTNIADEKSNYRALQKYAKTRIALVTKVLKKDKVLKSHHDNLLFLVLYIKAGIDAHKNFAYYNDARKEAISKLIDADIRNRKNITDFEVIIKPPTGKPITFNNLKYLSAHILKDVINAISISLQLPDHDKPTYDLLMSEEDTTKKLEACKSKYKLLPKGNKSKEVHFGADVIIKYLNDHRILYHGKTKFGTNEQLELIIDLFKYVNLDLDGSDLRNFRERIRYSRSRTSEKPNFK